MTTATTTLRAILMYAVVLPLAIYVGWISADTSGSGLFSPWFQVALLLAIVASPLLLKWHHPVLFLSWNMTAVVFFLPGHPQIWLAMAFLGLVLALIQRALLQDMRWIHAPSVVLPVVFLGIVVYVTAGLQDRWDFLFRVRVFGSEVVGAKGYYWIFGGIVGLLAMISRPVPPQKAGLYLGLFFLGTIVNSVGSLLSYVPANLWFVFWIFPVDSEAVAQTSRIADTMAPEMNRFFGLSLAAMGCYFYLFARYGIQGIFQWRGVRRLLLVAAMVGITAASGFRSFFILLGLTFLLVFYFEGLVRTKYMTWLGVALALSLVVIVPFASRLPLSIQRTLSFLPIEVDPIAAENARVSSEWRVLMWKELLPEVPKYLLIGKGIGVSSADLQSTEEAFSARAAVLSRHQAALLVGNYHNGPLTIIIFFGIWGAIGLVWFFIASIRALYHNYLFGEESLKKINTFLLSYFIARTIYYLAVFGDFRTDFPTFCGIIGLSLALNGGIRKGVRVHRFVQPMTLRTFRPAIRTAPAAKTMTT
jgi:hypothetical protein